MARKFSENELSEIAANEAARLCKREVWCRAGSIETYGVPEQQEEIFCSMVEEALRLHGVGIQRNGRYFVVLWKQEL